MATTITLNKSKEEIEAIRKKFLPKSIEEKKPQYTYWQLKLSNGNITAYQSGKVLIQGKGAEVIASAIDSDSTRAFSLITDCKYPEAGSDEVGCGDYFGPIVVGVCIVPNGQVASDLIKNGLNDTKKLTDKKIKELAKMIEQRCETKLVIAKPEAYNKLHKDKNMVEIKSILHNKAWCAMASEQSLPGKRIVDQFCTGDVYYKYNKDRGVNGLTFETKADSKYVSVMCAAVIARNRFLEEMDKMEAEWRTTFHKGAGKETNNDGVKFIIDHGYANLRKVAKTDFKNTKTINKLMEIYGVTEAY